MIAICLPAEAQCSGMPTTPVRTGSLRRIDDIVNELLAGYRLPAANSCALAAEARAAALPANFPARANATPGAMLPVAQHSSLHPLQLSNSSRGTFRGSSRYSTSDSAAGLWPVAEHVALTRDDGVEWGFLVRGQFLSQLGSMPCNPFRHPFPGFAEPKATAQSNRPFQHWFAAFGALCRRTFLRPIGWSVSRRVLANALVILKQRRPLSANRIAAFADRIAGVYVADCVVVHSLVAARQAYATHFSPVLSRRRRGRALIS